MEDRKKMRERARTEVFEMIRYQLMVMREDVKYSVKRLDIGANCQIIDFEGEVICGFSMTDPGDFLLDCMNQDFDFNMQLVTPDASMETEDFEVVFSPLQESPELTLIN